MKFKKNPDFRAITVTWILICVVLVMKALGAENLGGIGPDNDDAMRLVQVRDFLAGQSWFDVSQYRMGPDGGTAMHWSRIADIPLIVLTFVFDLFLPAETAESLAISIWPPMTVLLVVYGIFTGARNLGATSNRALAGLLIFISLMGYFRFIPGAIDHHNIQIALIAIAIGHAFDPQLRARSAVIGGIALALSVAIGPEVYFFVALICAYFALRWLFDPKTIKPGVTAMGIAFAVGLALTFLLTTAPKNYLEIYCDSFSLIIFLACFTGGTGLATAARFTSHRNFVWRAGSLAGLGAVCLVIILLQAPQCLANPLDGLPTDVRTHWLDRVDEAQPLFANKGELLALVPYALGAPFIALIVAAFQIAKGKRREAYILVAAFLCLCIGLVLYQVRFMIFAHIASLFALIPWVVNLRANDAAKDGPNLRYIGALILSVPLFWGVIGILMTPDSFTEDEAAHQAQLCYSENIINALNELPPGRIVASSNAAAPVLMNTKHSVLSGNYHRNTAGISAAIQIFIRSSDEAEEIIRQNGVDYIHVCNTSAIYVDYASGFPDSLASRLLSDDVPEFAEQIGAKLEDGAVTLYRIKN